MFQRATPTHGDFHCLGDKGQEDPTAARRRPEQYAVGFEVSHLGEHWRNPFARKKVVFSICIGILD